MQGRVKWFNDAKGFGFISAESKDYFVHYAEIVGTGFKSLKEGDNVMFQPDSSPKGAIAREVVRENPSGY